MCVRTSLLHASIVQKQLNGAGLFYAHRFPLAYLTQVTLRFKTDGVSPKCALFWDFSPNSGLRKISPRLVRRRRLPQTSDHCRFVVDLATDDVAECCKQSTDDSHLLITLNVQL